MLLMIVDIKVVVSYSYSIIRMAELSDMIDHVRAWNLSHDFREPVALVHCSPEDGFSATG